MRSGFLAEAQIRRQERRLHRTIGRYFRKVERYTLDHLPDDTLGRVTGRATMFEERALVAPLSGRPCVYYRASVTDTRKELLFEECAFPFLLEDGHGRAVVVPMFARVRSAFDLAIRARSFGDIENAQRALLLRRGGRELLGRRLVFHEAT